MDAHPLDGTDLVVFDKDGALIDFHAMWGGADVVVASVAALRIGR